jgi:hypothetical protein
MKTVLAYIVPPLLAFAVLAYSVGGVAAGINLALVEVARLLAGLR